MAAGDSIHTKHTDMYLTNFIVKYLSPAQCGEFIAPGFRVKRPSDKYLEYGKENMRIYDDKIGRRDPIKEIDLKASDKTYTCEEYGQAAFVYDRDQSNVDRPVRIMEEKTMHVTDSLERSRSYRVLQIAASTSLVPSTNKGSAWATPSSATPVNDILSAMINVEKGSGRTANAIVMTYEVAMEMVKTTQWKEYFKYTDSGYEDGLFNAISGLKQWGLTPYLCQDRGVSSYEGCSSDPDWETMLSDKVITFRREENPTTASNCFMMSPYTTRREVERFRKDEERGTKITVRDDIDELLVNASAGYILDNVL